MPKIDPAKALVAKGSRYPKPFDEPCAGRTLVLLAAAGGLTQFGVNLTTLAPGAWASQRHWHEKEDEFVYVLTGELVLVEDEGETVLKPGDSAAWKAGMRPGEFVSHVGKTRVTTPEGFYKAASAVSGPVVVKVLGTTSDQAERTIADE